ncbi:MAG: bifunctional adenosylcobinamide kinase/adenosylcobinamide-phosphate guanylyltransferase [Bacteroidales bacterium]
MKEITLITGGQRSGKSSFAQKIAEEKSGNPIYLATARIWDNDFKNRIERHKADRGDCWQTIEEDKHISKHNLSNKTVLMDCVTLWLNNFFYDNNYDVEKSLEKAKSEWDKFITQNFNLIVVTNELGMGVHAENETSRKFADLQGWVNQYIAARANIVYLMVSGISIKIK